MKDRSNEQQQQYGKEGEIVEESNIEDQIEPERI